MTELSEVRTQQTEPSTDGREKHQHKIDELIEAQNQVIRFILERFEHHGKGHRINVGGMRSTVGPRVYGVRLIEKELRRQFGFTERRCGICRRWLPEGRYYKHPDGRAGLQPNCKECACLSRVYGGKDKIPREVLEEFTA